MATSGCAAARASAGNSAERRRSLTFGRTARMLDMETTMPDNTQRTRNITGHSIEFRDGLLDVIVDEASLKLGFPFPSIYVRPHDDKEETAEALEAARHARVSCELFPADRRGDEAVDGRPVFPGRAHAWGR